MRTRRGISLFSTRLYTPWGLCFPEKTLHKLSAETKDLEGCMHRKAEQTLLRLSSLLNRKEECLEFYDMIP